MKKTDYLGEIQVKGDTYQVFDINLLEKHGVADIQKRPFTIKVLIENLIRKLDSRIVHENDVINMAKWRKSYDSPVEIPFHPARILMQDFTGVPAVVDLASMREAVKTLGLAPAEINPVVPVDVIIDHSVQVDYYGTSDALRKNVEMEYQRNRERYSLLKWVQKNFENFRVVPPNSGICHQVNLEHLGQVISAEKVNGRMFAYPDSLIGTDSHTTMINGIGILGWGVGGIEAEAVMLGQPYYMTIPEVIGVKIVGELKANTTATDVVLGLTELLRQHNLVEKFVEYFGPGIRHLSLTDRATIANMAPEYGATVGYFPIDEKTIDYLCMTGREKQAALVEAYTKEFGFFYENSGEREYTRVIEFDLSTVAPSIAGPARPQDRIAVSDVKKRFVDVFDSPGAPDDQDTPGTAEAELHNGSVVIAAITSCTNTSNPHVMLGAGLLARKAVEANLRISPLVKTSLAPGSKVVQDYLKAAGLLSDLETLGFHMAGYGCTTCIGNSGPLHPDVEKRVTEKGLTVAAVLSGNRNFEARIHQQVKANFLMSPPLVVAYALAGTMAIDLTKDPIAHNSEGVPVYLKDIWPDAEEVDALVKEVVRSDLYAREYDHIFDGDAFWETLPAPEGTTYDWDALSTYIQNPPYFDHFSLDPDLPSDIKNARVLLAVGDSVTTDHISPAGAIPESYPAGQYLVENGLEKEMFNTYGSRRGNHNVMKRGTFGNIRIKNHLVAPKEGSFTLKLPEKDKMFVYDAAMGYERDNTPLIVIGGKNYGTGSSRDWAAKGTRLLGVRAVLAESFERIHRSNLVGMGVLPLVFNKGQGWEALCLDGTEVFSISGISDLKPRKVLQVRAEKGNGEVITFDVTTRLDTGVDVEYYVNGGILPYVLRKIAKSKRV